ncbi:MAG: DUF1425 domain-containing protein [Opitutales bacterium]
MKASPLLLLVAILAAGLPAGCQNRPGPYRPEESTKYTIENTGKFILADAQAQAWITCTGLQEKIDADGRLAVIANIMNRENCRVQVQIRCTFKDEAGVPTDAGTPWQTLILGENDTEAVPFTALNGLARQYTIAVREAR